MSSVVNDLLSGEFLGLPGMGIAATVGITSTVMSIGLRILGYPYSESVVTAVFTLAGAGGILITIIGAIAYSIFATEMQRGNDWARDRF